MKSFLLEILEFLKQLPITIKDIIILIAGVIGSIVAGFKKKMNKTQFIQSLLTGIFVSWLTGIFLGEYLNLSNEVVYAFCALGGHFSDEILNQVSIVVKSIATHLNNVITKWLK